MSLQLFLNDLKLLIKKYEDETPDETERLKKRRLTDRAYYEKNRDRINANKRKSYKKIKEAKKKMLENLNE